MAIVSTPEERTEKLIMDRVEPRLVPITTPKVALFVAHGMGQQLPFQTLDEVAQGLLREAERRGRKAGAVRVENVQIGATRTQRVEIDLRDISGDAVEVHLYEGYWAPITEGRVNIRDVMAFLVRAGGNGLLNFLHPFQRWMFGRFQSFGHQKTGWALILALLVVFTLVVFNALAATYGIQRLLGTETLALSDDRFRILTTLVGGISGITVGFGVLLMALLRVRPAQPSQSLMWRLLNACAAAVFWLWAGATASGGLLTLVAFARPAALAPYVCPWLAEGWLAVWVVLLVASYAVRTIMVQFPGDVAAYVATHTLDRFSDIRSRIKKTVLQHLQAVYEAPEGYEAVVVAGHSLGSVVAYDALNALMVGDALGTTDLRVVRRTRLLLTFGSPLDKTAFIFAAQGRRTTAIREAAAASLQPLILHYSPYRTIKWINIHAKRDIVSGPLNFYDVPDTPCPPGVINLVDADALVPLVAHVEYWKNPLLFQTLYAHLTSAAGAPRSSATVAAMEATVA